MHHHPDIHRELAGAVHSAAATVPLPPASVVGDPDRERFARSASES